jgi:nucleoside-diphosphate-sugar epimerase
VKVMLTGATGFIGSHLVSRLVDRGDHLTALVRPGTDTFVLESLGVQVVRGDVRDQRAVELGVADCQVVYHLARSRGRGASARTALHSVNVEGAANVARAAVRAGVEQLVHCSSTTVYGHRIGKVRLCEDTPIKPDSPYAQSKVLGEQAVWSHAGDRLSVVVARITSVLGPRSMNWIDLFRSIAARRLRMIGPGDTHHHPADVSDIVEGLLLCGTVKGAERRTYILAGGEPILMRDMIQLIAGELDVRGRLPRTLPAGPFRLYMLLNEVVRTVADTSLPHADGVAFLLSDRILDISRARQELGYAPSVSVPEAIHRMAQWYRTRGYLPLSGSAGADSPEHALR